MGSRTVEELTEIIIKDITVGAEGTAVRSGIIGEVGVGTALNPNELKSTRAAARASRATGAAISFHHAGRGEGKFTVLDMVEAEGADLNRVIIGHSNHIATQIPYMKRLLERGVYIQFDLMGEVIPRLGRIHDYDTVRAIVQLIRDGYADRLLLSQDVYTKTMMKTYGDGVFLRDGVRPTRVEAPGSTGGGPPSDHGGELAPGSDLRQARLVRITDSRLLAGAALRTGLTA